MLINKGLGIGEAGTMIIFLLPSLLVLVLPMSILLAVLIALGRLSGDSEITAMKASGISLYQMLPAFICFCGMGFVITGMLTLYLLPVGNHAFKNYLLELAKKHSESAIEEKVFNDSFNEIMVYADRFDRKKKRIKGILISDKRDPAVPVVIVAENAMIFSDSEKGALLFKLFNGSLHRLEKKSMSYQYAVFNQYEMTLQTGDSIKQKKVKPGEITTGELIRISRERDRTIHRPSSTTTKINVEIHKRFAFPFACLVFGILGISLGMHWSRGGRSYGFVVSIAIVFFYYLFLNIGENLAKSGYFFVSLGIWMPNVVLGAFGIYLFRKAAQEKQVPLILFGKKYFKIVSDNTKKWINKKNSPSQLKT